MSHTLTERDLACLRNPIKAHPATNYRLMRLGLLCSKHTDGDDAYRPIFFWREPTPAGREAYEKATGEELHYVP